MAAFAWSRSRSLLSRVLSTRPQSITSSTIEENSFEKDMNTSREAFANKRFLNAIRDGVL